MQTAGGNGDFGALAQQYWRALSEAMQTASGASHTQQSPWQESPWKSVMDQWSQLAGGNRRNDAGDAVERFSAQAKQWLGMMQQVAGQFAGRSASAEDIASAWKQAMGGGGNPFASLFSQMGGRGQSGFDQWYEQIAPMMGGLFGNRMPDSGMWGNLQQEAMSALRMPAFGMNREHQERWQALVEAQLDLQRANDGYNTLMLEAGRNAFDRFERKLAERSEPGRQLQSARALFDVWIDAAEEAYAEIALSAGFRKAYGELVNAQMRVRAGIQREVELLGGMLGMPGRTEVDSAHRKIAELERQVRRLRDAIPVQSAQARTSPFKPSPPSKPAPEKAAASKPAPKKAAAKRPAAPVAKNKPKSRPKPKPKSIPEMAAKSVKRGSRQAIAEIAMPEPLKPMQAVKPVKRKR